MTIPALPISRKMVANNDVVHEPTKAFTVTAEVSDSDFEGYYRAATDAPKPFDEIYIRKKNGLTEVTQRPVLVVEEETTLDQIDENTTFIWEDALPLTSLFDTPEKIRESWRGSFSFQEVDEEKQTLGLRRPQIGALHAIAAHFSTGTQFEAATVVLPTGTGKTETMLASLVYSKPKRVLVLVPSDALRKQISEKFQSLGILRELGCVVSSAIGPKVAILKKGLTSTKDVTEILEHTNVIVALPNVLSASSDEAINALCDGCSDLIIDEAHHGPAKTWNEFKKRFATKKIIQFTATPFRNDGKHIGGKIVFNYKLSDAQADQYYKPIRLDAVEEFGEEDLRNRIIAQRAISILREDLNNGFDHLVMARVKNRIKAEEIKGVYQDLAPEFFPVVVYSGPGQKRKNEAALHALTGQAENKSRVVICVNMLGEGFDLPQLKIAAIHDNHKSLAITLQFIGRFTRKAENVGDAAVVINTADTGAEKALERLYSQGADWDHLISRLSEEKIEGQLELQDVIEELKSTGDLHEKISLWNLHPSLSMQVYQTKCNNWTPESYIKVFPKDSEFWHAVSDQSEILVVVGYQENSVKWGRYENLIESSYDLLIASWNKEQNVLFVNSSNYDRMKTPLVAKAITSDETVLLSGPKVFNVLNNVELPLVKSLGSSRLGAISFTSYFGPNVTEGLANIEKSEAQLNNIACLGYEDGEKVIWGAAAKKGKIWQQKNGTINEWLGWSELAFEKIQNDLDDDTNVTKDFLRPKKIDGMYSGAPISIHWGEYIQSSFSDHLAIIFGDQEIPIYNSEIELLDTGNKDIFDFAIVSTENRSVYSFTIDKAKPNGYLYKLVSGPPVKFKISKSTVRDFDEQMYTDPLVIRYADGTFSYNNFHIPFNLDANNFPTDRIEYWDWNGVPLNRESMGKTSENNTIQFRTFENIQDQYEFIFNDDGPGEAADLVCIRDATDGQIELCLIHCKNAVGGVVSGNIENLYTVCGQAQKSINVKHAGLKKLSIDLKRRHEQWAKEGHSRIMKGDLKKLAYFVEKSRKASIKFEVLIVQPGISPSTISPSMAKLLSTTELFLKRTTDASFRIIGSE